MSTSEKSRPAPAEYRLHWENAPTRLRELGFESDRLLGAWVGSSDPQAVKRFAAEQAWPVDKRLEVEMIVGRSEGRCASVVCAPEDVAAWNPVIDALPMPRRMASPPRPRSAARLDLLETLRNASDQAIADGVLGKHEAAGLMLATREALREHARRDG